MFKVCTQCKKEKSLDEFYKHKTHKDGRRSECKECSKKIYQENIKYHKEYRKEYHKKNSKIINAKSRKWAKENRERHYENGKKWCESHRDRCNMYSKNWRENNPEKYRANQKRYDNTPERKSKRKIRLKTYWLVKSGKIKKQPCEVCGIKAEIHHNNYDNIYDIKWLCPKHHRELHNKLNNKKYE